MTECQDLVLFLKSLVFSAGFVSALFLAFCYGFKKGSAK